MTQTADTIIHLRQIKHRKEAETIAEHIGYQDYSSQREQQIQAAVPASCQRSTNLQEKTMGSIAASASKLKHPYETLRIALPDVPGKENEVPPLTRKALRARIPIHDFSTYDEEVINLHFPPLPPCLLKTSPSIRSGRTRNW